MKNFIPFVCILFVITSCENNKQDFVGIGEFEIGKDFHSMKNSKFFTEVMDDEYNVERYKLSEEIGYVSNLNVTVSNGKIREVTFSSNLDTNVKALDKIFENLTEFKRDSSTFEFALPKNYIKYDTKMYISHNDSVVASLTMKERSIKSGFRKREYSYIDREAMIAKYEELFRRLK